MSDEVGWLIERNAGLGGNPIYLRLIHYGNETAKPIWVEDANTALRFSRKEDGENVAHLFPRECCLASVVEHMFCDSAQPASPQDGGEIMSDHDFPCRVCNVSESTDYLCVKCGHCTKHYCKCPAIQPTPALSVEQPDRMGRLAWKAKALAAEQQVAALQQELAAERKEHERVALSESRLVQVEIELRNELATLRERELAHAEWCPFTPTPPEASHE